LKAGQPPLLTIHGDADTTAPFTWAVEFDAGLARIGAAHDFQRVPAGGHDLGQWNPQQLSLAWNKVRTFLAQHDLMPQSSAQEP
jgi:fermentation-respiration switch protein FrsA (DUF1100 family)